MTSLMRVEMYTAAALFGPESVVRPHFRTIQAEFNNIKDCEESSEWENLQVLYSLVIVYKCGLLYSICNL